MKASTMAKKMDLTGQRFGRLTVIKEIDQGEHKQRKWLCRCDCGKELITRQSSLRNGSTRSCGCLRNEMGTEQLEEAKKKEYKSGTALQLIKPGRKSKRNKSGHIGVFWDKRVSKWGARIGFRRKMIFLGYFERYADAVAAREAAEDKYYRPILEEYGRIQQDN